ncbi:uncharacterized protein BDV17DRAFT_106549 [Aspergillus undulatus]|uniref:uncharacterized protein n=1 Tax=Aspergillus undulatus TaxID=1810928 RepID=UPI003CCCA64A
MTGANPSPPTSSYLQQAALSRSTQIPMPSPRNDRVSRRPSLRLNTQGPWLNQTPVSGPTSTSSRSFSANGTPTETSAASGSYPAHAKDNDNDNESSSLGSSWARITPSPTGSYFASEDGAKVPIPTHDDHDHDSDRFSFYESLPIEDRYQIMYGSDSENGDLEPSTPSVTAGGPSFSSSGCCYCCSRVPGHAEGREGDREQNEERGQSVNLTLNLDSNLDVGVGETSTSVLHLPVHIP